MSHPSFLAHLYGVWMLQFEFVFISNNVNIEIY